MKTKLRQNWRALFSSDSPESDAVFDDLTRRYSEPTRFYHTLSHLKSLLVVTQALRPLVPPADWPAVRFAVYFHDAIYNSLASDNEYHSARLAERSLGKLGVKPEIIGKTVELIQATRTHEANGDDAANVLLDADLSILGVSETEYDAYVQNIRREYSWVDESAWRVGRSRNLKTFLTREFVYQTPIMRREREAAARGNLGRELSALAG